MHTDLKFYIKQLKYVEALYEEVTGDNNKFLCPICFKKYDISPDNLTKNHVPAASLGGKKIVFTCKKCNGDAGALFESHLKENTEYFINKNFPAEREINSQMDADKIIRGYAKRTSKNLLTLSIPTRINNPEYFDLGNVQIDDGTNNYFADPKTKLKVENSKVIISYLKTAYLQIFWRFGYIPIYDTYFQPVRDQIQNPDKEIYPLESSYFIDENRLIGSGVNLIVNKDIQFLLSSFKIENQSFSRQINVIFPLMHTGKGIAHDTSVIYNYISNSPAGTKGSGNIISEMQRPILDSRIQGVADYLVKLLMC